MYFIFEENTPILTSILTYYTFGANVRNDCGLNNDVLTRCRHFGPFFLQFENYFRFLVAPLACCEARLK